MGPKAELQTLSDPFLILEVAVGSPGIPEEQQVLWRANNGCPDGVAAAQ